MPTNDGEFERRAERLRRAGQILFGERWQSPTAELLGVSQPTIANIISGQKGLSADLENRLEEMCIEQADTLSRKSIELARLAVELAGDRRRPAFYHMRLLERQADDASYEASAGQTTSGPGRPRPLKPPATKGPRGQKRS